jgi:hypothetical protein
MAGTDSADRNGRLALRLLVVGVAVVVGLASWLATRDDDEPAASESGSVTRLVDATELANIAALSGRPIYWAGPMPGSALEAIESPADGGVQVRYVDAGAEAGEESGPVLTIGSYPLADPAGELAALAERPGSVSHRGRDGREVVVSRQSPTSAYFASPDGSVQVEVYDPSPRRALALALSAKVRPAR